MNKKNNSFEFHNHINISKLAIINIPQSIRPAGATLTYFLLLWEFAFNDAHVNVKDVWRKAKLQAVV